jgi:hypothetical protein
MIATTLESIEVERVKFGLKRQEQSEVADRDAD